MSADSGSRAQLQQEKQLELFGVTVDNIQPSPTSSSEQIPKHPSQGSARHASGKCRPCIHIATNKGCALGYKCSFCHYSHEQDHDDREYGPRGGSAARGLELTTIPTSIDTLETSSSGHSSARAAEALREALNQVLFQSLYYQLMRPLENRWTTRVVEALRGQRSFHCKLMILGSLL